MSEATGAICSREFCGKPAHWAVKIAVQSSTDSTKGAYLFFDVPFCGKHFDRGSRDIIADREARDKVDAQFAALGRAIPNWNSATAVRLRLDAPEYLEFKAKADAHKLTVN